MSDSNWGFFGPGGPGELIGGILEDGQDGGRGSLSIADGRPDQLRATAVIKIRSTFWNISRVLNRSGVRYTDAQPTTRRETPAGHNRECITTRTI